MLRYTKKSDTELYKLLEKEVIRQETSLEMIASESIVPIEIMELSGSIFTNKTLEGYPGKRFQTGAEIADLMEELAINRGKELFESICNIDLWMNSVDDIHVLWYYQICSELLSVIVNYAKHKYIKEKWTFWLSFVT